MPLHTFLPSPAEMLPLLLATSVVDIVMAMAAVMMLHLVTVTVIVIVAMGMTMDVTLLFLLAPVLIFINCVVGGVCL